jgi:glutamate formiminotransferase
MLARARLARMLARAPAAAAAAPPPRALAAASAAASAAAAALPLLACHVYISEGRDAAAVAALEAAAVAACAAASAAQSGAAARHAACLAHVHVDAPYHRTNLTLLGRGGGALAPAAAALAAAALGALDLRAHAASHPRLGIVDHVHVTPVPRANGADAVLDAADLEAAAEVAHAVAAALAGAAAASAPVPVFLYGAAHARGRPLDAARRALGYFGGEAAGLWAGALDTGGGGGGGGGGKNNGIDTPTPLPLAPCLGPAAAPPRAGVACVGAAPWVTNFNALLATRDLASARRVSNAVSQRRGGLAGVQAMALPHAEGVEVACNLLDPAATPPAVVLAAISAAADAAGIEVSGYYVLGRAPEELRALAAARLA